ncbi:MAG: SUMF1/EgtB/PvdO family nonheme iron enzyme [Myxococcales bacterium]|nr:SUMF1/EgtB/PvdO family nonheme iron enzyme [Myxococcales bacterium]
MSRTVSFRVSAFVAFTLGVTALGAFVVRLQAGELPIDLVSGAVKQSEKQPLREWRLVDGKHWQIAGPEGEAPEVTDKAEGNRGACGPGMVEVKGQMKTDPPRKVLFDPKSVEELQKRTCTKWIQKEYPERCAEFDRDAWLALSKDIPTKPMHFCMDRFEYPNRKGVFPIIFVTWHEAKATCEAGGKRLCNEEEWTFACEGEEATPYPYGYTRSADKCVIDGKWRAFNERALHPRDGREAMLELDKLWQGVPSGDRPGCRSPMGVYDMTGNIDEWTHTAREGERPSILKGGYWGPVRTRCRPSTRSHDENHVFYQQGFRCCSDVPPPEDQEKKTLKETPPSSVPRTAPKTGTK